MYMYFLKDCNLQYINDYEIVFHTVHPDTINAERSPKRGYKQQYRGNTQGKKT